MKLKSLFERFFADVWGGEDEAAIARWMLSDVEAEGILPKRVVGPAEFAQFHQIILGAFTDVRLEIAHSFENDDWVALCGSIHLTDRATGMPAVIPAQMMMKFVDDRLAIGRNALDFMSLFEATGALPENTLGQLLNGGKMNLTAGT